MLKIKHNRTKMILKIMIIVVVIFYGVVYSVNKIKEADEEKRYQKSYEEMVSFCEGLFDEKSVILEETTDESLAECKEGLKKFSEDEKVGVLRDYVENATNYREWTKKTDEFVDENDIVKTSVKKDDVDGLEKSMKELDEKYQELATKRMKKIKGEYSAMEEAHDAVAALFKDGEYKNVKSGINRKNYENAEKKVKNLAQEELKKRYEKPLKDALEYVEKEEKLQKEREEAARKAAAERKKKIAASWHRLNISPYYINQVSAGYLNGCEAASLLMAMKYKGYIRGTSFKTFADNMPRSDNPNEGFFSDMKTLEPKEVGAHWIAPSPLAAYGRSYSGNVINATGWSLDRLDEEVKNGNPVVIYLTWSFNNAKKKVNGVPTNLHVMVLSGYNSYTGEQEFYDPWPSKGKNPSLSKARTNTLYKASGMRAVVVK